MVTPTISTEEGEVTIFSKNSQSRIPVKGILEIIKNKGGCWFLNDNNLFGSTSVEYCTMILLPPNIGAIPLRSLTGVNTIAVCPGATKAKERQTAPQQVFETSEGIIGFKFIIT